MTRRTSSNIASSKRPRTSEDIYGEREILHRRCGIYTKPAVVTRILDAVGWRSEVDLSTAKLLEPAAGDGAFVVEAARRLIASCLHHGLKLSSDLLAERITAAELHPREARRARHRVVKVLREGGLRKSVAKTCARHWVKTADFLLMPLEPNAYSHTVGNPPYVRWSKVPPALKAKYTAALPRDVVGGDLFLPFLDRALESLRPGGACGFLCSDRWRYMAFADGFRKRWLPRLAIQSEDPLASSDAFLEDVDSYPSILTATKRAPTEPPTVLPVRRGISLGDLGCEVRVGPALGHTPAFVLSPDGDDVEAELLRPWVAASEISEGAVTWTGRRVVVMHDDDGHLLNLKHFPLLKARLARYRKQLKTRSIVANGAKWYRPIDKVRAADWLRPKILVPELSKVPRCAIDRSGAVPSHGVYAIFVANDDVDTLYERLEGGRLAQALRGIAPSVKGGYVRCYRRFLELMRLE